MTVIQGILPWPGTPAGSAPSGCCWRTSGGPGYASESHYLKVYAYRIRRKLGDEQGQFLQSDPSVGYRLAPAQ